MRRCLGRAPQVHHIDTISSADEVVLLDATAAVQLEVQGADRSWHVGDKELLSMERTGGVAEDIGLCGVVSCAVLPVCH